MLKGLDPLLTPDLLHTLALMGHGDVLAIVDRNYPAVSTNDRVVRLDGVDLPTAARAVLTVLPVDTFVDQPLATMSPVDAPGTVVETVAEVVRIAEQAEGRSLQVEPVERFAFYERVREAFAVVTTTDDRPYANVLITKGVV